MLAVFLFLGYQMQWPGRNRSPQSPGAGHKLGAMKDITLSLPFLHLETASPNILPFPYPMTASLPAYT